MTTQNRRLITAAIDFGTTFSGYAYGFSTDLEKTPPKIIINLWGRNKNRSRKAPTSVLFEANRKFHSFGYEAEEKYVTLCEDEINKDWYFFRRFKMLLFDCEELSKTTVLREVGGKTMLALDVFAASIRYLSQHLMEAINLRVSEINSGDVKYVLTVPAIWDDASKMFMREAALKAGIKDDQLIIALEPESASVYCQTIPTEKRVDENETRLYISAEGSKFMVIDMGGGTVDITVHQRQRNGTLKELVKASGGPWGGTCVDTALKQLLRSILGGEKTGHKVFTRLMKVSAEDCTEFFMELEIKKKEAGCDASRRTTIKLPYRLLEVIGDVTGEKASELLDNSRLPDGITRTGDKLRLEQTVMGELFEPTVKNIVQHLKELLSSRVMDGVSTILLVGGFSSSPLIQNAIINSFPDRKVIVPDEPELSVLMGAVLFGYNPNVIAARVVRYTYGTDIAVEFNRHTHPAIFRATIDGIPYCLNVFSAIVQAGQIIQIDEKTAMSAYQPISDESAAIEIRLFAAPEGTSPVFVTDDCCKFLGSMRVKRSFVGRGLLGYIELSARFGETEIEFYAKESLSGRIEKMKCDFLG